MTVTSRGVHHQQLRNFFRQSRRRIWRELRENIGDHAWNLSSCWQSCQLRFRISLYRFVVGPEPKPPSHDGWIALRRSAFFFRFSLIIVAAVVASRPVAGDVIQICDLNADRLVLLQHFGAHTAIPWHSDADEFRRQLVDRCGTADFDCILEFSGAPEAEEAACRLGDVGARVILVAAVMASRRVSLDSERIVRHWLSIRGVHNYAPQDLQTAVEFLSFHRRFPSDNCTEV